MPTESQKEYTLDQVLDYKRSCNGCTACCTGTLTADIYGYPMRSDTPCHFKGECGCTIYDKRPQLCKAYTCVWLTDTSIPEWMKPNLSNVIITQRETVKSSIPYYAVNETQEKMDTKTLSWLVLWAINHGKNLTYMLDGCNNIIGSNEFLEDYYS